MKAKLLKEVRSKYKIYMEGDMFCLAKINKKGLLKPVKIKSSESHNFMKMGKDYVSCHGRDIHVMKEKMVLCLINDLKTLVIKSESLSHPLFRLSNYCRYLSARRIFETRKQRQAKIKERYKKSESMINHQIIKRNIVY
tara:strand:+ start:973 stop:1389 length:417 start_codon:yes stop_codon:yes gene_type:complete